MWYYNYPFDQGKQVLIIRHGERYPISPGTFGHDVCLTEQGKQDSEKMGERLRKIEWGEIHSSPIVRCAETSQHFLKGAGQNIPIQFSSLLGNPGIFIDEPEVAGRYFLEDPINEIAAKIFYSEPFPGMRNLEEGGRLFIDYLKTIERFPCLMISHDIIIALLKSYFFKTSPQIPNYLDGFSIQQEEVR